jgi:hypothetical protein
MIVLVSREPVIDDEDGAGLQAATEILDQRFPRRIEVAFVVA